MCACDQGQDDRNAACILAIPLLIRFFKKSERMFCCTDRRVDPARGDYASFADFSDPDGNSWVLQERGYRNA